MGELFEKFCSFANLYAAYRKARKGKRGIAFQRRFRHLYERWIVGEIDRTALDASARSWSAHASWGDTFGLRRAVLSCYVL